MPGELVGRVAIVTGAGTVGALGWESARVLAADGAKVVIADLDGMAVEKAAQELRDAGYDVAAQKVDITDEAQVKALVGFAVEKYGTVDILDNNAGFTAVGGRDVPVADASLELWQQILAVNVCGTMLMCKHVVPLMVKQGKGSIVNISSAHGLIGHVVFPAYAASKAAVIAITRDVATTYGPQGVRCNAIAPGCIATAENRESMPADVRERVGDACVLRHLGDPVDIANAVAFLASDRSAYVSGQTLSVDGGLLMHLPSSLAGD